ncbi:MAG: cytochrome c-type biogenesis protein CcmH [Candidatus Binatia bacterium]
MGWGVRVALLVLATVLTAVGTVAATTQQEVEEALTCQCGCGLTVHSCNHLQCPSGEPIKKEIAERLARGENMETILAAFRQRFGEKVLSAPTFKGFNWLAWITPFAAVLTAAGVLTLTLRRRVRAAAVAAGASPAVAGDPAEHERIARALAEFDRES